MSQERGNDERGFAALDPEERRKIAEKGGQTVSKDREHMSEIGRKGGQASGETRDDDRRER
jgi:general stress protein YciG